VRVHCGVGGPHARNGWAFPAFPPSDGIETAILTSKGWEEGEDDAVVGSKREGVSDREGEFASAELCANNVGTVEAEGEVPPPVGCGLGRALSIGLGARGQLRRPVRRQGWARRHTGCSGRSLANAQRRLSAAVAGSDNVVAANVPRRQSSAALADANSFVASSSDSNNIAGSDSFAGFANFIDSAKFANTAKFADAANILASWRRRTSATFADSCAANVVASWQQGASAAFADSCAANVVASWQGRTSATFADSCAANVVASWQRRTSAAFADSCAANSSDNVVGSDSASFNAVTFANTANAVDSIAIMIATEIARQSSS
jgi:hypothetical protein